MWVGETARGWPLMRFSSSGVRPRFERNGLSRSTHFDNAGLYKPDRDARALECPDLLVLVSKSSPPRPLHSPFGIHGLPRARRCGDRRRTWSGMREGEEIIKPGPASCRARPLSYCISVRDAGVLRFLWFLFLFGGVVSYCQSGIHGLMVRKRAHVVREGAESREKLGAIK